MLVSEKYLSKLQNETKFMKIGHTMPELQPFTFHEKFVAHPVYNTKICYQGIEGEKLRFLNGLSIDEKSIFV